MFPRMFMKVLLVLTGVVYSLATIKGRIPEIKDSIALAGPDQTIYLTQTSSVTLDGKASSVGSYHWTKITDVAPPQAGFPTDSATIVSPDSAITSVTGLIQGVWYYQLAVTNGGVTALDTVVIRVDYDVPPQGDVLVANVPITDANWAKKANDRSDTTNDIGYTGMNEYRNPLNNKWLYFERARSNQAMIDSSRGKLYNTLEDGYHRIGEKFDRTQVTPIGYFYLDSNKTYVIELKFYFPQSIRDNMDSSVAWAAVAIYGIHASDAFSGIGALAIHRNYVYYSDNITIDSAVGKLKVIPTNLLSTIPSVVGQAHTMRVTIREGKGYIGQKAFVKVEIDGIQKYRRDTGNVGRTWQRDYLKMTGLYDYGKRFVDPDNHTRNKKFSLVTEAMRVYEIQDLEK